MKNPKKTAPAALSSADFACLNGMTVLVTGGTGSFGKRFVETALKFSKVRKLIVFSRDELKQSEMAAVIKDHRIRFFVGDIRDPQRLQRGQQCQRPVREHRNVFDAEMVRESLFEFLMIRPGVGQMMAGPDPLEVGDKL